MLDPPVLLLDEPLGALDPIVRAELQTELRRLFGTLGKTVLLVTHDIREAVLLGDDDHAADATAASSSRAPSPTWRGGRPSRSSPNSSLAQRACRRRALAGVALAAMRRAAAGRGARCGARARRRPRRPPSRPCASAPSRSPRATSSAEIAAQVDRGGGRGARRAAAGAGRHRHHVSRASRSGSIDVYPEYTGTIGRAILKDPAVDVGRRAPRATAAARAHDQRAARLRQHLCARRAGATRPAPRARSDQRPRAPAAS